MANHVLGTEPAQMKRTHCLSGEAYQSGEMDVQMISYDKM